MLANHDAFAARLTPTDLIYNLSDVEKYLPKLADDWSVETITRKRKERQDSGSSSAQERKVIRSNSEERTCALAQTTCDDNIRRVSSHEDFEKSKKPPTSRAAVPLHEQNYDEPQRSSLIDNDYDAFYAKDASSGIGEKYSHIFGQNIDNEHSSTDYFCLRQKYSKNDSSPSRSRIHEYILFPKRISPNRDPGAGGTCSTGSRSGWGGVLGDERDHERARCSERRSRARRPPRRQQKQKANDQDASKENDQNSSADKSNSFVKKEIVLPHSSKKSETITLSGEKLVKSDITQSKESFEAPVSQYSFKERKENCKSNHVDKSSPHSSTELLELKKDHRLNIRDRSQSPTAQSVSPVRKTPIIDLTMLHEQLGQNEPVPSVPTKLIGFPWDADARQTFRSNFDSEPLRDENVASYDNVDISKIRNQRRTLPDKRDVENVEDLINCSVSEPDERLHKIAKKLQGLKKKITKCEVEFEISHGYRASQADKMNDELLSKLYVEVRRLKNERKCIKAGPGESLSRPVPTECTSGDSLKSKPMTDIMTDIEHRLELKRNAHGRPQKLEDCSYIQLTEEKAAVQRALLWLEGARGRPTAKADRDAARHLYDRYRAVKRLVARYDAVKANNSISELATIMEHEAMLFTNLESPAESPETTDKPNQSDSGTSTTDLSEKKDSEDPASSSAKSTASDDTTILIDDSGNISNENLHCLPLKELNKLLNEAKALKATLRKNIKLFEADFEIQNSRKVLKDERQAVLPSYMKYKETKARLRLLNALINKKKKSNG
ncbi:protein FAM13A [Arctopsyche grandis]|uniref:protein FAM13A n=1 Tax=Arctopsyche grandis TaxID=121162 RepID=UPI00406D9960